MAETPPDAGSFELVASIRAAIDGVDRSLIELIARRRALVAQLFAAKRELALPLLDPAREAELIADRRAFAGAVGVPVELADHLVRALLDDSHALIHHLNEAAR